MSLNYSQHSHNEIVKAFDKLMSELPSSLNKTSVLVQNTNFKKEIEICSQIQARQILLKLLEKSKVMVPRKNWNSELTNYLLFIIDRYCKTKNLNCQQLEIQDWTTISKLVPNRDRSACEFRYLALRPSNISHLPWSHQERELLLRIIQNQNFNAINWKLVSQKLYELSKEKIYRTGKQCREHYTCFLKPNLKKGAWTDDQDYQLMSLFLNIGKKWSKMTKFIEGRNENSIKNRFFLIFESKNERCTHSDLVKMVRRRKQKIQKKIVLPQFQKTQSTSSQNINLTLSNSDSSNQQQIRQQNEEQKPILSNFENQIFQQSQNSSSNIQQFKLQVDLGFTHEEFQRYIDL